MPTAVKRTHELAGVLVAGVLVLAGCTGPVAETAVPATAADGTQRIEVAYAGGEVTGGVDRYAVPLGATVEVVVSSDVADEVHVHGYDRSSFVTAGASTTVRLVADLPGVFEVELEQRAAPLAELQVE